LKEDIVGIVGAPDDVEKSPSGKEQKFLKCFNASDYEGEQELTPSNGLTIMDSMLTQGMLLASLVIGRSV
jgi:hypothetical protein